MQIEVERQIAIPDFYGLGKHIYEDELGWNNYAKSEARSFISRDIFECVVVDMGLNLSFYYVDNDTFYGLHTESIPIELKILPRNRDEEFVGWQCNGDTHSSGEVLYSFDEQSMKMWETIRIDGKPLDEILERSYIIGLC